MKDLFKIVFLTLAACRVYAAEVDERSTRGIIHDWKVAPLQTGIGYNRFLYLFDGSANAVVILTPIGIEQRSGVVSFSGLNGLVSNYGLQMALLYRVSESNYGISLGLWESFVEKNYGLSIGLIDCVKDNYGIQAGAVYSRCRDNFQICGINIADRLRISVANLVMSTEYPTLDIGLFNAGSAMFQIGILNYNPRAFIPWFPLFNFTWNSGGSGCPPTWPAAGPPAA